MPSKIYKDGGTIPSTIVHCLCDSYWVTHACKRSWSQKMRTKGTVQVGVLLASIGLKELVGVAP